MNKCIKVILNRCFEIDKNRIKDINETSLKLDMNKAKEIIEDANLSACRACNKSSDMWKGYYFKNRWEAENEYNSIETSEIDKRIQNEFNTSLKKIKDISKIENQKYIDKIKENVSKNIKSKIIKEIEGAIEKKDKERYTKEYREIIQNITKEIMKNYNTGNVGALDRQLVQNNWKRDKEKILIYEARIPQYKKDTPFYFKNNTYKLINKDGYFVELSFFSKNGFKQYNLKNGTPLKFQIDKLDGNKKATLNKIISGEYQQGTAQIQISDKDKIELTISFSFEPSLKQLDKNKTLGIDLGIVNVATMSIWNANIQEWDYISYKQNILSGQELIQFRQKLFNMGMSEKEIQKEIQKHNEQLHQKQLNKYSIGSISGIQLVKYRNTIDKRSKELNIASKYIGEGRKSHGYKTKMKPLDKIRDKTSNFADTFNHKYSKYIVDFAVKNNCGIIQMEDLSSATKNTNEKFLKDWSYYDLQNKIEYKAEEVGIKVIYINPKYTSKRCSKCGCIHIGNRDCKNNQAKFECKICGHTENADINASKNIAIPFIDKIIAETKIQGIKEKIKKEIK